METNLRGFSKRQIDFLERISQNDERIFNEFTNLEQHLNYYDGLLPQPLVYAIHNHVSLEYFKLLVEAGSDPNQKCEITGTTPMHHAVRQNRLDIVKLLVENGCELNVKDDILRRTPLYYAIEKGFEEISTYLIQKGCDTEYFDLNGESAVHLAVLSGSSKVLDSLIEIGSNVSLSTRQTLKTPVHLACSEGFADILIRLIKAGSESTRLDIDGNSPTDIINQTNNYVLNVILTNKKEDGETRVG